MVYRIMLVTLLRPNVLIKFQLIANGAHLENGVDAPKPVAKEFKQEPEK